MKKMNSILMLCLVMVVTSCAKPTNETKTSETTINTTENNMESIIFDAAKKTDQNAAEIFDLGSVSATGSVTKTFSISNTTGSNLTLNFTDLQAKVAATTRFSLNLATATPCSTTMKTNKTCSFDLTLKGVSNESYDAISTNIIDSSSRGSNAEFGSMVFSGVKSNDVSSSVPLSSVLRIDRLADSFIVPSGSSVTKRFYIGNIGTAALQPISIIAPDGGTISLNSCTALTALKPNGTCFFEIKYTSDSAPEKASYNSAITFGSPDPLIITTGLKIDLAITNQQAVTPVVSANFNQVGTISDLTSSTAKTRLYINNTGSTEIAASSITIPSPFLSSATSCSTLKVGKSCFYDLTLDTTKTVNSTTIYSTITIGSSSFSIKAGDLTKSATTCKSGFSVINNSCSASTVTQACSANGGTGTQTSSDGGVTFGSCQLASCSDSKYAVSTDKLSCQAISCTTSNANISQAATVSGTLVSGCVATSCTSGYVVSGSSCVVNQTACSVADATSNGVNFSNSNGTVQGMNVNGDKTACLLADNACSDSATLNSNKKSCDIKTYNVTVNKLLSQASVTDISSGQISCGALCSTETKVYNYGSLITLSAVAEPGYVVTNWTGCDSVSENNCVINSITSDRTVSPVLSLKDLTLSTSFADANIATDVSSLIIYKNEVACSGSCLSSFHLNDQAKIVLVPNQYINVDSLIQTGTISNEDKTIQNQVSFKFNGSDVSSLINLSYKPFSSQPIASFTGANLTGSNLVTTQASISLVTTNESVAREVILSKSNDCSVGSYVAYNSTLSYAVPQNQTTDLSIRYKNGTQLSNCLKYTITNDSISPTVTIDALAAINNSNKANYVISGSCSENGQNVSLTVGSLSNTVACNNLKYSLSLDTTSLADDAALSVSANIADTSGNTGSANAPVLKDTVDPTLNLSAYNVINISDKSSLKIGGSCSEAGATVSVVVGHLPAFAIACNGTSYVSHVDVSAEPDAASVLITASLTDAAGNNTTTSVSRVKDTVAPILTVDTVPLINDSNKSAVTISGTCSENNQNVIVTIGSLAAQTIMCNNNGFSQDFDLSSLADIATLSINVKHYDAASNVVSIDTSTAKDTEAPTISITSTQAINSTNQAAYTVSGTCSENNQTVTIAVGALPVITTQCQSLTFSKVVDASGMSDGKFNFISASVNDAAGNSATANVNIVKDTILPTVTIATLPVINSSNKAAYTVSGTCSESGRNVEVAIGGFTANATCTLLTYSTTLNVSAVVDSTALTVSATTSDAALNYSTTTTTVVKDTQDPTISLSNEPAVNYLNASAYTVSGNCSIEAQTVNLQVGSQSFTTTCSSLLFSKVVNIESLADSASLSITASITSLAGNSATATLSVVKDTTRYACTITNGTGTKPYVAPGVYGTCSVYSCDSGYSQVDNTCIQLIPQCTLANYSSQGGITADVAITGVTGLITECTVTSCASGYRVASNQKSCENLTCTFDNATSYGVSSIAGVATFSGTIDTGCSIATCSSLAHYNSTTKVCDSNTITCTSDIANADFAEKTWNSTSSTYGTCTVSACSSGYTIIGNTCISSTCDINTYYLYSTLAYDSNILGVSGTIPSGCQATVCSNGFTPNGNGSACVLDDSACTVTTSSLQIAPISNVADFSKGTKFEGMATGTLGAPSSSSNSQYKTEAIELNDGSIIVYGQYLLSVDQAPGLKYLVKFKPNGVIDSSFNTAGNISNSNPGFGTYPTAVAYDKTNNKIYVAMNTSTTPTYNGNTINTIIRLNADGTLDTTFNFTSTLTNTGSQPVTAMAVLSNGSLIIGGSFTNVAGSSTAYKYLAKLTTTGSLDTTFSSNLTANVISASFSNYSIIRTIAVDSSDNIYVGGAWSTMGGVATHYNIAKLSSAGVLSTTFLSPFTTVGSSSNYINKIAIGETGYIYAVGAFSTAAPYYAAKINSSTGALDSSWTTNVGTKIGGGPLYSVDYDSVNSTVHVAGSITSYNATSTYKNILSFTTAGVLNTTFAYTYDFALSNTTKYGLSSTLFNYYMRATGTKDVSTTYASRYVVALKNGGNSGRVLLLSNMNFYDGKITGGYNVYSSTGSLVTSFNNSNVLHAMDDTNTTYGYHFLNTVPAYVSKLKILSDGKLMAVGGNPEQVNVSSSLSYIYGFNALGQNTNIPAKAVKFNADSTLDTTFNADGYSFTYANNLDIMETSDSAVLLGGYRTSSPVTGYSQTYSGVTKINKTTGSLNTYDSSLPQTQAYANGANYGAVRFSYAGTYPGALVFGKNNDKTIMVGGLFNRYMNSGSAATSVTLTKNLYLAKTDSTFTTYDTTWNSVGNSGNTNGIGLEAGSSTYSNASLAAITPSTSTMIVRKIITQSDGKILIGGAFSTYNGVYTPSFARLNSDGSLDTACAANYGTLGLGNTQNVRSLAIQSDGKILIGGKLTSYQKDSNSSAYTLTGLVRLNADCSLDTTFLTTLGSITHVSGTSYVVIHDIQIDSDKILLGGLFNTINGNAVRSFARLNSDGSYDTAFNSQLGTGPGTASTTEPIFTIVVRSSNKYIVGGSFTGWNGNTGVASIAYILNGQCVPYINNFISY